MNRNKIIKILCLLSTAFLLLSACSGKPQMPPESQTEDSTAAHSELSASEQESSTQTPAWQPVTEEPETQPVTEPVTEPVSQAVTQQTTAVQVTVTTTVPSTTQQAQTQPPTTQAELPYMQKMLNNALTMTRYYFISKDEINKVSSDIADDSDIYYVRLQDGTNTFYIAVDLQTAQALALANPQVLKQVCLKLEQAQNEQAAITPQSENDADYIFMDYTHLVGELELHFAGYLLTGALGGEAGPLARFYNSCKVADLNIDENRFGPIIDIIGTIVG